MADHDYNLSAAKQKRHKAIELAEDLQVGQKIRECFKLTGLPREPTGKLEPGHYHYATLAIPGSGYMLRLEFPYGPNNMAKRLKCIHVDSGEYVFFVEEKGPDFKYQVFRPGSWINTMIHFWEDLVYRHKNKESIAISSRFSDFDPETGIY